MTGAADMATTSPEDLGEPGHVQPRRHSRPFRIASLVLGSIAGAGALLIMLLTVADITLRRLRGLGLTFTLEVCEVVLVVVVFAGMMSAQLSGSHIGTPIVTTRLQPRLASWTRSLGLFIACAVVAWIVWLTARAGLASFGIREYRFGLTSVPIWPAKLLLPLGCAALLAALLADLIVNVRAALAGDTHVE